MRRRGRVKAGATKQIIAIIPESLHRRFKEAIATDGHPNQVSASIEKLIREYLRGYVEIW